MNVGPTCVVYILKGSFQSVPDFSAGAAETKVMTPGKKSSSSIISLTRILTQTFVFFKLLSHIFSYFLLEYGQNVNKPDIKDKDILEI